MSQAETEIVASPAEISAHEPLGEAFALGREGRLLFWIAVAFSTFQIATAAHVLDMPSQVQRAIHLGFLGAPRLSADDAGAAARAGAEGRGLGAGGGRGRGRGLSVVGIRGADLPRRRPDRRRYRDRRPRPGRGLRRGLDADGAGAADHRRGVPRLCALRGIPATTAEPPRLRLLPGDRPHGLRDRGHLRHSALRLRDLHLPLHPVRFISGTRRDDPPLHRCLAWPRRPPAPAGRPRFR